MHHNKYNRGGKSLKAMDIGRMSILRQHLLYPGETLNASISGNVRLSGLRQQTSVYLHVSLEAFAAPVRWYQLNWTDYVKEGISTSETLDKLTGDWLTSPRKTSNLGVGKINSNSSGVWSIFARHPIKVWNEHYRWAEDARIDFMNPTLGFYDDNGKECVNLPNAATRLHDAPSLDTSEYQVSSATTLDVRELAKIQGRFHQAAQSDWTSMDRYNAFLQDIFKGPVGNKEVDQVPIRLAKGATLSVMPRDMYATDGPSLGELMSINNFQVSHSWKPYTASEHEIVCYVMLLRFAPIFDENVMPGLYPDDTPYEVYQGDPHLFEQEPVQVKSRELEDGDGTVVGYLPFGWQAREGFSHVDERIAELLNFPLLANTPQTASGYRDATNIANAFRSTALRHAFGDLDMRCEVRSQIPDAGMSIVAGSNGRGPRGVHPISGPLI